MEKKEEFSFCNSCMKDTYHKVVFDYRNNEGKEEHRDHAGNLQAVVEGWHDWEMLECQGCKTVCLKSTEYFSEWANDPWDDPTRVQFFPAHNKSARSKPSWYALFTTQLQLQIPQFILLSYNQVYELLESRKHLAAILVCRALLETIAIENGAVNNQTFKQKLEVLRAKEIVSSNQVNSLNEIVYDAGSAAIHRGYNPSEQAVNFVVDAIEKILHTIYVEPHANAELRKEIPPRKKLT